MQDGLKNTSCEISLRCLPALTNTAIEQLWHKIYSQCQTLPLDFSSKSLTPCQLFPLCSEAACPWTMSRVPLSHTKCGLAIKRETSPLLSEHMAHIRQSRPCLAGLSPDTVLRCALFSRKRHYRVFPLFLFFLTILDTGSSKSLRLELGDSRV